MKHQHEHVLREMQEHLPFSIFFTAAGIVIAALLTYRNLASGVEPVPAHLCRHAADHAAEQAGQNAREGAPQHGPDGAAASAAGQARVEGASRMLFHVLHPIHVLLSAMATTAMFWRYDRRVWRAILTGFVGAVGVCGLSDVFFPYLCGRLLNATHMHFHWCLIEHPRLVLPFVAVGILCGFMAATSVNRSTVYSHSAHVLVSCIASLFYLISFGVPDWFSEEKLPYTFAIVVLCVTVPCCLSDILFPAFVADASGHSGHDHGLCACPSSDHASPPAPE